MSPDSCFSFVDSLLEREKTPRFASSGYFIFFPKGILGDFFPVQDLYHGPGQLQGQYFQPLDCSTREAIRLGPGTEYGDITT